MPLFPKSKTFLKLELQLCRLFDVALSEQNINAPLEPREEIEGEFWACEHSFSPRLLKLAVEPDLRDLT